MANDNYLYPEDPLVVGRRGATASRTEDGVLRQFDRVIVEDRRIHTGVYSAQTGLHSVSVAAHVSPAGFWFLVNPIGSTSLIAMRRIEYATSSATAGASVTRITLRRFTFTGTGSGAQITPAKIRSTDAAPTGKLFTANTGLTITPVAEIFGFIAVATATPMAMDWLPTVDGQPVLTAGEGIACWQPDAGVTTDPRKFVTNVAWDEYTEF